MAEKIYKLSEFLKKTGIKTRQTISNWEKKGLLVCGRSSTGRRIFTDQDVEKAMEILGRKQMRRHRLRVEISKDAHAILKELSGTDSLQGKASSILEDVLLNTGSSNVSNFEKEDTMVAKMYGILKSLQDLPERVKNIENTMIDVMDSEMPGYDNEDEETFETVEEEESFEHSPSTETKESKPKSRGLDLSEFRMD